MKYPFNLCRTFSTLILLAAICAGWWVTPLTAQTLSSTQGQPIDVVVLLDDSGSMATCWPWPEDGRSFGLPCRSPSPNPPSDPNELRYSAARLLLQLADEGDRIAVLRFDSQVQGVGSLGGLQPVGSADNRLRLAQSLTPPTNYAFRGYTRFDLGLEQAIQLLDQAREPGRNQYVLLLSDGEPSQPQGTGLQRPTVTQQVQQLRDNGVLVFPVVVCNPSAGCAGEFLRARFDRELVRDAKTAQDILQIFSQIFTEMKRDRYVITDRGVGGAISFNSRAAQGVRQVTFVTPKNGLVGLTLNDSPLVAQNRSVDPNIDVTVASGDLPAGSWLAQTADFSGFAVIQADSYPELLFPPASVADSSASVRYYPAGRAPLVVARGVGPGAAEPLLLNGDTPLLPVGENNIYALQLSGQVSEAVLQLGQDGSPLQLLRRYRLEARSDLPQAQPIAAGGQETELLPDGRVRLQATFGPAQEIQNLAGQLYITDETVDDLGRGRPVYQASLLCANRVCGDEGFEPGDGRSYRIRYTLTGQSGGMRFGDWAETALIMEPAVYLRGMPAQIDLAKVPAEGLPVTVVAGTTEEIGRLSARLTLRREETGEVLPLVGTDFELDVPEEGGAEMAFRVTGLQDLRPGHYVGELTVEVADPNGAPMQVTVRPGSVLPVLLDVPRPTAQLAAAAVDFGEIKFSSSPSSQLADGSQIGLRFQGEPFALRTQMADGTCPGLDLAASPLQPAGEGYSLPLQMQSLDPLQPGECRGTLLLSGPNADYDVVPGQIEFKVRVADPEWTLITGDLDFHNLGRAGERSTRTLLMRYAGKTPFTVQLAGIGATGEAGDGQTVTLGQTEIEMPPLQVDGAPNPEGLYELPLTLVARRGIPLDPLRGSYYAGDLQLSILGLSGVSRTVSVSWRSPTLIQRYISPWLMPIYTLPWALLSWPLTLLFLLILLARIRGRGYAQDEVEPVITVQMPPLETLAAPPSFDLGGPFPIAQPPPSGDSWSSGEWGGVWAETKTTEKPTPRPEVNGVGRNPWESSW